MNEQWMGRAPKRHTFVFSAVVLAFMLVSACSRSHPKATTTIEAAKPIGTAIQVVAPLGLPPVPIPPRVPVTAEAVALGRRLFYEPKLSQDNTVSCATCHNPALGFSDGRPHSTGVGGKFGVRNAPTVLNAAYSPLQFWDGRADSLEQQAAGPIANPVEMNQTHEVSVTKLGSERGYQQEFDRVFGPGPITMGKVEAALASFERTVLSGNSPFDRYHFGHDDKALLPAAQRGFQVFVNPAKGNCLACHSIQQDSALFTDGKFHNIGVGVDDEGQLKDVGRYEVTKRDADRGAFKTPTLRNVAITAPYMHDGSLKTLKAVVDFYAGQGNSNPHLDPEMKKIKLTGQDRADLVAFLESLTGEMPPHAGPPELAHR